MDFLTLTRLAPQGPSRYSMVETTRTFLSIWPASPMPGATSRGRISKIPWLGGAPDAGERAVDRFGQPKVPAKARESFSGVLR